ncbi:fibronectin type III domain-containing protein [Paenibacillus lignilyticus]|uniref:Fibronectin type III domain-containing protein n=1 Tax=Paenibacillus lignilyticus TaxID=1172615 RepID=A0ABS5C9F3_9BACL|nr:fibronectin type III domain-containing protein [Paenibacillus lignilyticus]MBP3962605.1 fibronectin type III domain-containing protein [Paenibacillus lignilyticus]
MMFRRYYLLALSVLIALSVYVTGPQIANAATSYYVATTGSDTNSGTQASPFKTIQKAASIAVAGDTVIIRGGTYRETITPANSGSAGNLITYQAYTGETVTVSGADAVTAGWSVHSGSVYKATTTLGLGAENQVFVNGEMMIEARWPNITDQDAVLSNPQFRTAAGGSVTQVSDSGLTQAAGYYTGARIWVDAPNHWVAQTSVITNSAVGSVTFNTVPSDAVPGAGSRYYLYGKLNLLDTAKEWYYSAGTLYLQAPGGGSPTNVEVKARQYAFNLANKSYIQIKGLKLFASSISTNNSNNNIMDGIDAKYVTHTNTPGYAWGDDTTGIQIKGNNNVLKNSQVAYSSGNCVVVTGSGNSVVNNEIHECDYNGTDDAGIYVSSYYTAPNTLLAYNTIYKTGRGAILPKTTSAVRITYNDISHFSTLMDDAGAIYVFRTDGAGSEIDHNYIHDGDEGLVSGIYLDNGSSNFLIHHNVMWNLALGFAMNPPSHFNLIYNNTLYGIEGIMGGDDYYSFQIFNNILEIAAPSNYAVWGKNLHADVSDLRFVNSGAGNFRLQSGSKAIDAGQVIAGVTDGYTGSLPDVGAYEYGGADWTPGRNFASPPSASFSLTNTSYKNLLANSDFENGLNSWTKTNAQTAVTESSSFSGWSRVKLGTSADGVQQVITGLSPNTTYTLSGWGSVGASGTTVRLGINSYGGSDQYVTFDTTSQTRKSLNFTTGAANTSATIYYLRPAGGSANAYGDAFGVTLVQPAADTLFIEPVTSDYLANSLTNPGFESDFTGWPVDWTNTSITTTAANVHSGTKAMQLGTGTAGRVQSFASPVVGAVYRLGGWVKVTNPSETVFIGIGFVNSGGSTFLEHKMNFHSTGYEYKEILFKVPAGTTSFNVFPFILGATGLAYVDDLTLNRVQLSGGGSGGTTTTVYEAENGTFAVGAQQQNASNASGGKVVGNINSVGAYSQIASVNGAAGGNASLVIRYANGYADNRSLSLYVNGVDVQQITFAPTGSWNTFADTAAITIPLNVGTGNTIKLQRDSADVNAADIDKYTITTSGGTSDTTAPSAPTNLASPSKTDTSVDLTWTASTDNVSVTGYDIYRGGTTLCGSTTTATSFTCTGLTANTAYSFTVKAKDAATNVSAASSALNITTNAVSGLPSPWLNQDIGSVGIAGSTTYASSTFTISGAGIDIWGTADSYQFAYRTMNGDGEIVARVANVQNTDGNAKAGVMIRESLAAGSKHAMMNLTPGGESQFIRRTSTDGTSVYTSGGGHPAPYWVKLVRSGTTISAYTSANGSSWSLVGAETISMTTDVYVGLAVLSKVNTMLNTSTIDNVSVIP